MLVVLNFVLLSSGAFGCNIEVKPFVVVSFFYRVAQRSFAYLNICTLFIPHVYYKIFVFFSPHII